MSPVSIWIILAVVAAVVEILSPLFGFIFLSAGALIAALAAALGQSLTEQVVAFLVTLALGLLLLRPRLVRRSGAAPIPSRTDRLLGQRGRVTEAIDPERGTGRILVAGEDWAARSPEPVPAGAEVIIDGADGIVLTVSAAE